MGQSLAGTLDSTAVYNAAATCGRCGRPFPFGLRYAFPVAADVRAHTVKCVRCALRHPSVVQRAARVSLVVGSILTAINQGNVLLSGYFPLELLWKIPLTFAVPYSVSTYSALGALRQRDASAGFPRAQEVPAS